MADDTNILPNDQNFVRAAGFESSSTAGLVMAGQIDEITGRVLVDNAAGSGTVTSVSVVSANGFAGTVADETTTPAITLTTTVTGILKGNGTAISAVTIGAGLSFDGTTLTATGGGAASEITVANEATDTTCFPVFVTAATGDLGPKSNANLTYNSNTGALGSTSFVGALTGNASTATALQNARTIGGVSFDGTGNITVATATGGFTVSGGNLALGTNSLTLTGSIAETGSRVTKVWATDVESTNMPTVGGTSLSSTFAPIASPTFTGTATLPTTSLTGVMTLAENTSIALDPAGSADGKYTGVTIAGTAGATLAFGDLVYLAAADSRWELADADSVTTADRMLGMCVLAAAADGDPTVLLLMGTIRADAAFPALTIGSAVYVGETAGDIQVAIPTGADNVIRRVGYALTADEIYFNPSMDSQTTVA